MDIILIFLILAYFIAGISIIVEILIVNRLLSLSNTLKHDNNKYLCYTCRHMTCPYVTFCKNGSHWNV